MIDSTIVSFERFFDFEQYYKGKVTKSDKLLDGIDIKIAIIKT
jgi:hypothetical protein